MAIKMRNEIKKIFSNQRGVALMMVMTSIIILMAIYSEFTFDSKISRLKATNILDRSQAKLLAESGLQLALARIRLYKEAFNMVQNNPNAKKTVQTQLLNQLWEVPFIFPIPITSNANASFKDTVAKFQKETLLDGEMKITIQNISNRMNLNLLRMDMTKPNPDEMYSTIDLSDMAIQHDVSIDQSLYFLLKKVVEQKKDQDEDFNDRYGTLNYQELITNLKFYMSDYQSMNADPLAGQADSTFQKIPLSPKFGPLSSNSELYAIPGWTDELIELIQNEFSVYPAAQIDLNKLTPNMLRILIPNITDDDIKAFFEYKDDPEKPKFFNTLDDFKKYIVDTARLMSEQNFKERIDLFNKKGITFGSNPNLFKVVSEGKMNRSTYTLVAYVLLPTKDKIPAVAPGTTPGSTTTPVGGAPGTTSPTGTTPGANPGGATDTPTQLMEPRVLEIQIN